jgi:tetratricopeptide (TPR) repeat protein
MAESGNKITQEQQAQSLTVKGHELLNRGQYLEALETWKSATKIYHQLRLDEGITGNLINQNLALQGLGLYLNACDILLSALKIDKSGYSPKNSRKKTLIAVINQVKPTSINLLGLQNLGDVFRLIGNLDESEIVLKKTLSLTQGITPNQDISSILLSLGNTREAMYERFRAQEKWIEELIYKKETGARIHKNALLSLDYYQAVNNLVTAPPQVKLQTKLSSLRLLLDFDKWLKSKSEANQRFSTTKTHIHQQIQPLIDSINKNSFSFDELPLSQSAYAIIISEFNDLIQEKIQSGQEGIELLVLSACQTAKGNKRSALGMAGVAVQAGARSTLATLWQVDADSSALLMKVFYQGLKDGLTKVEALRLAQLQLISNPQYQHPSHWAAFLLLGGWL